MGDDVKKTYETVSKRKQAYCDKMKALLNDYTSILIATVDNIGSNQIQKVRGDMRGDTEFLFGKNTMMRKIVRDYVEETGNDKLLGLCDLIQGNCGLCFTKAPILKIRNALQENKIQTAAKAGILAPCAVGVEAGPTGMEPTMTAFFQSLNIATKINRGQIDIVNPVDLIAKGEKVGESQAALLIKLGVKPFYYNIEVTSVYDNGNTYAADVLDITPADVAQAFFFNANKMAALCLEIDYPTAVSVPHSIMGAYKNLLAVGTGLTGYSWDNLKLVKEILADPSKFASSGGGGGGAAAGGDAPAAAEPEPESESKSSEGGGGGLFGGSGSDSDSSS